MVGTIGQLRDDLGCGILLVEHDMRIIFSVCERIQVLDYGKTIANAAKSVKNVDLWQRLDSALARHRVRWHWVRGHAGHAMNERADELAREAIAAVRAGARGALTSP